MSTLVRNWIEKWALKRANNKFKRAVREQLDVIYSSCFMIGSEWETQQIPLSVIKQVIERAKGETKTKNIHNNKFFVRYNNSLDSLYNYYEKVSKNYNAGTINDRIPLSFIKDGTDIFYQSFCKGLNNKKKTA